MPFPFLLAAATVGSTALNVGAQIEGANANAEAQQQEARNRRWQAKDVLRRAKINAEAAVRGGEVMIGEQRAAYAASGVEGGSGSALQTLTRTAFAIAEDVRSINEEARLEAKMLKKGAKQYDSASRDTRRAGTIGAVGSSLTAATRFSSGQGWI